MTENGRGIVCASVATTANVSLSAMLDASFHQFLIITIAGAILAGAVAAFWQIRAMRSPT